MKKVTLMLTVCLLIAVQGFSQRFAYVDMDYILENIPAHAEAQNQLNAVADSWQKEIQTKLKEIDDLYKVFQAEQVLLTEQMKQRKIKEIEDREAQVKELQRQRFGPQGDLFKKRQELIKPIQDQIYDEVQKLATVKGYDFIFDKSSGLAMLYSTAKYDKSDDILKALGIK